MATNDIDDILNNTVEQLLVEANDRFLRLLDENSSNNNTTNNNNTNINNTNNNNTNNSTNNNNTNNNNLNNNNTNYNSTTNNNTPCTTAKAHSATRPGDTSARQQKKPKSPKIGIGTRVSCTRSIMINLCDEMQKAIMKETKRNSHKFFANIHLGNTTEGYPVHFDLFPLGHELMF
jgi:hypothetical protein